MAAASASLAASSASVGGAVSLDAVRRFAPHSQQGAQVPVNPHGGRLHSAGSWSSPSTTARVLCMEHSWTRRAICPQRNQFSGIPVKRINFRTTVRHAPSMTVRSELVTADSKSSADNELPQRDLGTPIWMSDVVASRDRPYFFPRSWNGKDITYAVYMLGVHALCLFAPATFSWNAFALFVGLYVVTGMLGITLSFHRHLSHKSFKLPKWLEYVFAYCGVQAIQGPPLEWVSAHRYHHLHCDTDKDPHTPYEGFWHSHMGWLLDNEPTDRRVGKRGNIADLENDPFYVWIEKTYPLHPIGMALILYAIGGFPYLVWGVAVRAVWVYHITWFVNSASHVWGTQKWKTGDLSRNNWWVGILAFGEGWHNNHHAFEYSARHGLEWWQVDMTWYFIRLLEMTGLATKVKYPSQKDMARLAID